MSFTKTVGNGIQAAITVMDIKPRPTSVTLHSDHYCDVVVTKEGDTFVLRVYDKKKEMVVVEETCVSDYYYVRHVFRWESLAWDIKLFQSFSDGGIHVKMSIEFTTDELIINHVSNTAQ